MSPFGALGRKWPRRRHQGSSLLNSNSTADAPLNCLMCLSMREELKPYILIKLHRTQDTSATSNIESKDQLRWKSEISPNIRNSFATSILATNMLLLQHHVGPCVYMWKSITGFSACTTCMLEGPTPFCCKEEHSKPAIHRNSNTEAEPQNQQSNQSYLHIHQDPKKAERENR